MPTISELLRDHMSLGVECVDRVYLNGDVPTMQTSGRWHAFWHNSAAR
jgi:hypothetical protein